MSKFRRAVEIHYSVRVTFADYEVYTRFVPEVRKDTRKGVLVQIKGRDTEAGRSLRVGFV